MPVDHQSTGRNHSALCDLPKVSYFLAVCDTYAVIPTKLRENVIRERAEGGRSWSALSKQVGYALRTVRRWVRHAAARTVEITSGLLAVSQRLDKPRQRARLNVEDLRKTLLKVKVDMEWKENEEQRKWIRCFVRRILFDPENHGLNIEFWRLPAAEIAQPDGLKHRPVVRVSDGGESGIRTRARIYSY